MDHSGQYYCQFTLQIHPSNKLKSFPLFSLALASGSGPFVPAPDLPLSLPRVSPRSLPPGRGPRLLDACVAASPLGRGLQPLDARLAAPRPPRCSFGPALYRRFWTGHAAIPSRHGRLSWPRIGWKMRQWHRPPTAPAETGPYQVQQTRQRLNMPSA